MAFAGKLLLASAVLALALLWLEPRYDWIALQSTPWQRIGLVLGLVAGGAGLYAVALFSLGLRPADLLKRPAGN
jgi:putative peptidoglycan lipid II flippase